MCVDLCRTSPYPSFRPISSALFLTLLLFIFLSVFLISKRQRERRDKGERIDKEEYHLLCALFYLSSILFLALPMKIVFLLSFPPSLPSLLLTRAFDFRIEEKKRREKRNYLVLVPEASIVRLT